MNDIALSRDIGPLIHVIRGHKVMLDSDLAELYGVPTKALNRAVKRNAVRFPPDFMFQLTLDEARASRRQFGTLNRGQNIKYLPRAFTEQGVAMLSSVLKSGRAALVNIAIMRAFVRMRAVMATDKDFAKRLAAIESRLAARGDSLGESVAKIAAVLTAIKRLMEPESDVPEVPLS